MKSLGNIKPFENKVWLSSPTMHGDELKYIKEAFETNWMSTVGKNINEVERVVAEIIGCKYAVALSSGTAALHMATKLAGERLYGQAKPYEGTLRGHKVFCSDVTFDATVNPVAYEDGEAVFIDTEYDIWNIISFITARHGSVVVELEENKNIGIVNWVGEEAVSFM